MALHGQHRYAPVAEAERTDDRDAASFTLATPSGMHTRARTAILMLIAGLAGAFISSFVRDFVATIETGTEASRLQNLLSCACTLKKRDGHEET